VENKAVHNWEKKSGCQKNEQIGVSKWTGPAHSVHKTSSLNGPDKSFNLFF